jgi:ABC-type multidrug transport system fused ATPase/permease subunit
MILRAFIYMDQRFQIRKNLAHLALFLLMIALFKAVTMFIHRYATKLASIRISSELRQRFFEHMQTLPMSFYQKHNMGSLSSRVVGDAALVAEALNACLVNYIETPFILVTTLILCFLTSWQLTLLVFFGFPLIIFPIVFLSKGVKRIAKQIQGIQEQFAAVLIDFIGGFKR